MKAWIAMATVLALTFGLVPMAEAAGGVPGQGRALYQYGE